MSQVFIFLSAQIPPSPPPVDLLACNLNSWLNPQELQITLNTRMASSSTFANPNSLPYSIQFA